MHVINLKAVNMHGFPMPQETSPSQHPIASLAKQLVCTSPPQEYVKLSLLPAPNACLCETSLL